MRINRNFWSGCEHGWTIQVNLFCIFNGLFNFKDVLSVDTVHQFLLCLRDTQDYDGIISLIDDLEQIEQKQITHAQVWRF
jgi:hypothetical protein